MAGGGLLPHDARGMSTDGGDECRQHCNHDVNDALQRPLCGFCHNSIRPTLPLGHPSRDGGRLRLGRRWDFVNG